MSLLKKIGTIASVVLIVNAANAQRAKVQSAWRGLSDYEETLKEGKPELSYLTRANEAIDLALANEDTKKQTKTHAYKMRISYALFQYNLNAEVKKLETIGDKNERLMKAYGKTPLAEFETAIDEMNKIRDLDPKYLETIQKGLADGAGNLEEDELKFAMAAQQMKIEAANIATGKYGAQQYTTAADFFYRTAVMNSILYKTMDTANFYNACLSANKGKDAGQILNYNNKMIDAKISTPYNYVAIQSLMMEKGDTTAAMEIIKKGRAAFPGDAALLTEETNMFLLAGKHEQALSNLKLAIEKDPKNPILYFEVGNIYDLLANPKDKSTGKDLPKPANFNEYFKNAESNYKKTIDLMPSNKDDLYRAVFNLGALYNNYGATLAEQTTVKGQEGMKIQKENETKALEYYNKAIPYLEQALALKQDDRDTMTALRRLYRLTGQTVKADEMAKKLKN